MKRLETGLGLSPQVLRIIQRKASCLAGRYGFRKYDIEDIEQDLLIFCVDRLDRFDPARASQATFFSRLINHRIATMVQYQSASCRSFWACTHSLDELAGNRNSIGSDSRNRSESLGATIPASDVCFANQWLRQMEMERVLVKLPRDLLHLAFTLATTKDTSEAARVAGISRATLYRKRKELRVHFADLRA